jgi:hypothetical protein
MGRCQEEYSMANSRSLIHGQALVLLALLSPIVAVAEQNPFPADRVFISYHHFHNASEAVHLQISSSWPGKSVRSNAMVNYDLAVINADGQLVDAFSIEAPIEGFAEVTFETGDSSSGYESEQALTKVLPTGQVQSGTQPDRASFRVEIAPSVAGRNPQTGEAVPIRARYVLFVSATTIDRLTRETRAATQTAHSVRQLGLALQNYEAGR